MTNLINFSMRRSNNKKKSKVCWLLVNQMLSILLQGRQWPKKETTMMTLMISELFWFIWINFYRLRLIKKIFSLDNFFNKLNKLFLFHWASLLFYRCQQYILVVINMFYPESGLKWTRYMLEDLSRLFWLAFKPTHGFQFLQSF